MIRLPALKFKPSPPPKPAPAPPVRQPVRLYMTDPPPPTVTRLTMTVWQGGVAAVTFEFDHARPTKTGRFRHLVRKALAKQTDAPYTQAAGPQAKDPETWLFDVPGFGLVVLTGLARNYSRGSGEGKRYGNGTAFAQNKPDATLSWVIDFPTKR